jgi:hypothetical protein
MQISIGINDNANDVAVLACLQTDRDVFQEPINTFKLLDYIELWPASLAAQVLQHMLIIRALDQQDLLC